MEKVAIDLGVNQYTIYIESRIINQLGDYIQGQELIVITDEVVNSLYGHILREVFHDRNMLLYVLPSGEENKTLGQATAILNYMLDHQLSRNAKLIAFGGGVVGDIGGFCASIYMRGIDYYQVPTTLLAQVDSSVGGKTAINMPQGKNLIGSFYQPKGVIIDPSLLATLPPQQIISGLGEVIKYGIILDYSFLTFLNKHLDELLNLNQGILKQVIKRCLEIKSKITMMDERESGVRKILNHGHTLGHSLEAATGYGVFTHGEAVLWGMLMEASMACQQGLINQGYFNQIASLIHRCPISIQPTISAEALLQHMLLDKKNQENRISLILPVGQGMVKEFFYDREALLNMIKIGIGEV